MKPTTGLLVLLSIFLFQACNPDCEEQACFTPPQALTFELVDQSTGENLLSNGTYEKTDIKIVKLTDQSTVEFGVIDRQYNKDLLQIHSIGWKTEIVNYSVSAGDQHLFNLYVDAERLNEDCCSFTRYHEVRIEDTNYEKSENTGIYRIIVN